MHENFLQPPICELQIHPLNVAGLECSLYFFTAKTFSLCVYKITGGALIYSIKHSMGTIDGQQIGRGEAFSKPPKMFNGISIVTINNSLKRNGGH